MLTLKRFILEESGQDLVEYALLASLLAIVSVAALRLLGNRISKSFAQVTASL